ncbi:hypothetical protein GCM10010470_11360 [Saccharopolyspora taberi]|uniref:Uncharacterized protein n=1 Tax=Saccharopolyspora taberi TaxID=60895 RepID=A0ABN3V6K3_9PSEU
MAGADEGDPGLVARARELGVLGQEAVAGVDGVGTGLLRRADDLLDGEVGPDGVTGFADLVGLVGFQPVQRVAVFVREHGNGARPELVPGSESANRDLAPVGDEDLAEHAGYLLYRRRSVREHYREISPARERLPSDGRHPHRL